MTYFPEIIGQHKTKACLSFQIDGFKASKFFPPTLLTAKRGGGKTEIARSMRKYLTTEEGSPRKFIEVNGATLRNPSGFIEKAVIPYSNTEVTYFIDECHAMENSVKNFFLNVINLTSDRKSKTVFDGMDLEFDFRMQSFLFATTDPQKLSQAFKSRCKRIDLEPYSIQDMEKIVEFHCSKNKIELTSQEEANLIAKACRNTPREAVSVVNDIRQYCEINSKDSFSKEDWGSLCKRLDIKPFGLSNSEILMLKLLKDNGEMSLTGVANCMSLTKSVVMNDIEPFLTEMGFIRILGKRTITAKGLDCIKNYSK